MGGSSQAPWTSRPPRGCPQARVPGSPAPPRSVGSGTWTVPGAPARQARLRHTAHIGRDRRPAARARPSWREPGTRGQARPGLSGADGDALRTGAVFRRETAPVPWAGTDKHSHFSQDALGTGETRENCLRVSYNFKISGPKVPGTQHKLEVTHSSNIK